MGWMSCGADGPLGRPALCPGPGFDTGSRRPVARHVSGQGSWSAAGKRSRRRRSGLPAVVRGPAVYGSRPPRPVCRFCRSCGVRGLAGEDAGGGFEFRSRFDDMLRGARGLGVDGQGIVGGIHGSVLPTKADTPDGLSGLARDAAVSSRIFRYRAVAIIGFAGASPRASRTRRPRCLGGRVAPVLLR